MSTCPQKDIHSVYIDGELPEKFCAEYEAHIASCAACQAELAKLRHLRTLLTADAGVSTPVSVGATKAVAALDTAFLDASFARLQTKLRYSRTVGAATGNGRVLAFPAAKWALSAAAAAAVVALVFIPLRTRASDSADAAVTVIANAELKPLSEKSVVIDGNISHTELSSLAVASPRVVPPAGIQQAADATLATANSAAPTDASDTQPMSANTSTSLALAAATPQAASGNAAVATDSGATLASAASVGVGTSLTTVGTTSARPLMEQRTVRAQTVSNGMRRSLQSVDVFRPSHIAAPAAVSRVIAVDGNISHESLSQLAVTDMQDDAR